LLEIEDIAVAGRGVHIKPIPLHVAPTRHHKNTSKALWEFLEGKSTQAQSCQGFKLWEIEDIAVAD
jgi:predicted HD phosphohydrolase